jgi:hypothetical protein
VLGTIPLLAGLAVETEMVSPGVINPNGMAFTDAQHGILLGFHEQGKPGSSIQYTDDGGLTWKDAKLDVEPSGAVAEGLCMSEQVLYKTVDGGKNRATLKQPDLAQRHVLGQIWFDSTVKKGWTRSWARC